MTVTLPAEDGDWRWWLAIAAALLAVLLVNPVGYIGGGADDWQYLNAARCWRNFGPCLPLDHWQSRWPVIAPLAIVTATFGESRATVEFTPLLASIACLVMVSIIGNRAFGRPIGWIAALLLIVTPVFAIEALEPAVEPVELALILVGVWAAMHCLQGSGAKWAFAAGFCLSLAIQVRETAVVAALLTAAFAARRRRPDAMSLIAGVGGFAIPLIVEFVWMALATGDPLWRLRLAIRHTQLQSSELLGPIDTRHPPFFNRNYIAHWHFVPGVHVHWMIDGLLNLFVNAVAGLSLVLVMILAPVSARRIGHAPTKSALLLWLFALIYCCILIYAFAIDPKPRMFMPALVCSNLALALLTWSLWRLGSRALAGAIWVTVAAIGIVYIYAAAQTGVVDRQAEAWIKAYPNQIESDDETRNMFALVDVARQLVPVGSGRHLLLYEASRPCSEWAGRIPAIRRQLILIHEVQRSRLRGFHAEIGHSLCLFAYRSRSGSSEIGNLLRDRPARAATIAATTRSAGEEQ